MSGELLDKEIIVTLNVETELIEPVSALIVGCLESLYAKGVDVAGLIDVDGAVDSLTHFGVRSYYVSYLQASDIEALRA